MIRLLSVKELRGVIFHHELLVMEGLGKHRLLGTGPALIRLGRGRDESPSLSRILSLSADIFFFRLSLEYKIGLF